MAQHRTTVLIADDSSVARRQLAEILESSGEYEVVGMAQNGVQAVKQFFELRPGLTCLDMLMPVMDGTQALRAIRARAPEARVVMVTSMGGVADRAMEAVDWGASGVVVKPLVEADVLAVLRAVGEAP